MSSGVARPPVRLLALGDADLSVEECGDPTGEPIVMLHGFLTSSLTWRAVLPMLEQRHRVLLVDLPGHGISPDPRARDWSAADCADLLVRAFDAMELRAPAVIGSQMGGSVAAWLAATHPERVRRLVVMAAGVLGETSQNLVLFRLLNIPVLGRAVARAFPARLFRRRWAQAHGPGHDLDPVLVGRHHQQFRARGPAMARVALGIRLSYGPSFAALEPILRGCAVPTLLLFGADDKQVPVSTGERFAELMPRSELVVLPGCGDFPQEERPAEVASAVLRFLRKPPG